MNRKAATLFRSQLSLKVVRAFLLILLALLLAPLAAPVAGQSIALIELRMAAAGIGYDGYYRAANWLPLQVSITNHTEAAIQASLVVRPQTSPEAVANTFSAPVYLSPEAGSRISVTLYIQPLVRARLLRLELLDGAGRVLAQQNFRLQLVPPTDHLYLVISDSSTPAPLDLSDVRNGDARVLQGAWGVGQIPEHAVALDGVDLMLISNADTGGLNAAQRKALAGWVAAGGHLIVTGGSSAARATRTAAGLTELLPLSPTGVRDVADLSVLARFLGDDSNLRTNTSITIGELHPKARVLLWHNGDGGDPLISQRDFGDGLVSYLSADPLAAPLNLWPGIRELWFTLALSANPTPGWGNGWLIWNYAVQATEIMPGLDLLPNSISLVGFLIIYITVVGPLNYLLLSVLRRREWAWLSIPAFIVLFSGGAWALGQQLRGTQVTLNRIAIVRAWPQEGIARSDQLLGLLSPRRDRLTLDLPPTTLISAPPISDEDDALSLRSDALLKIEQTGEFRALDFGVDASLVSHFVLSGEAPLPALSGEATLRFAADGRAQTLQGTIQNLGEETLHDPVLLFRNASLFLEAPLSAGESREFTLAFANLFEPRDPGGAAAPASLVYTPSLRDEFSSRGINRILRSGETSARELMGSEYSASRNRNHYDGATNEWQRALRRRLTLDAVMNDHSRAPGRGNRLYLAGWQAATVEDIELIGGEFGTLAETLYLVALPVEREQPVGPVYISADQFTWHAPYTTVDDIGPQRFTLRPEDEIVFEYVPLPEARLAEIAAIHITVRAPNSIIYNLDMQVWNWTSEEWDLFEVDMGPTAEPTTIREGQERYLGPLGRVRLRMLREDGGGFLNLNMLGVEFEGRYASEDRASRPGAS